VIETGLAAGIALIGALVPVFSVEVYLVGAGAVSDGPVLAAMAVAAAAGQTVGKLAYYYMGRGVLTVSWLRPAKPGRWSERIERWRRRAEDRPLWGAWVMLAGAFASLPPYAVMCVVAGTMRMSLGVFLATSMVGRTARFAVVVFAPNLAVGLFV
jgi:membrane protein YqaA with SNARE-associated domain